VSDGIPKTKGIYVNQMSNYPHEYVRWADITYVSQFDKELQQEFIRWSDLVARQTRCPVAEALFEDVWNHSYPRDALRTSRMHEINCVWNDTNQVVVPAGFDSTREVFRANNQYVTNATTYLAGNERIIAFDLVCTNSEHLTEYRVDTITPTDWQATVQQDLEGTVGRDQLPDSGMQRAYIAYNSYKGPLACRGAPNKHLLLDIVQSDSTDEDLQSKEEVIRKRLEPLSWRISIGSRMYSRKLQGPRFANRHRLEAYEFELLAAGDGLQWAEHIAFESSGNKYKLIDMPLVANEDVNNNNIDCFDLIRRDEATVFFHVGIQASRLVGQRSVPTLCSTASQWGGIVLPFIMNWESQQGEDKLSFRHMVFKNGMNGKGEVSLYRSDSQFVMNNSTNRAISPAQDVFYL
jgi:hypothetical protein